MLFPSTRYWVDQPSFKKIGNLPFHVGKYELYHADAHRHEYLEISLVIAGAGQQCINGHHYPIDTGTLTFLLPYQIYQVPLSHHPITLYTCIFDFSFLFRLTAIEPLITHILIRQEQLPPCIRIEGETYDRFLQLFQELIQEYENRSAWRDTLLHCKLIEILIYYYRISNPNQGAGSPLPADHKDVIWSAIHYVHANYQDDISLKDLSEKFKLSTSNLSLAFKKYTGSNFLSFLHELRIRHACGLLTSSKMRGIDIAQEVGFTSYKSFSRVFLELHGITPHEYRKQFIAQLD